MSTVHQGYFWSQSVNETTGHCHYCSTLRIDKDKSNTVIEHHEPDPGLSWDSTKLFWSQIQVPDDFLRHSGTCGLQQLL